MANMRTFRFRYWLASRIAPKGWGLCIQSRFPKPVGRDTASLVDEEF